MESRKYSAGSSWVVRQFVSGALWDEGGALGGRTPGIPAFLIGASKPSDGSVERTGAGEGMGVDEAPAFWGCPPAMRRLAWLAPAVPASIVVPSQCKSHQLWGWWPNGL